MMVFFVVGIQNVLKLVCECQSATNPKTKCNLLQHIFTYHMMVEFLL